MSLLSRFGRENKNQTVVTMPSDLAAIDLANNSARTFISAQRQQDAAIAQNAAAKGLSVGDVLSYQGETVTVVRLTNRFGSPAVQILLPDGQKKVVSSTALKRS